MNCANARANFSAYVEHELSEQERRQTAAHLGRCPRCSRDLFAMQKAMSLIRWVPRADARPGFEDRLFARLHSAPESAPAGAWWSRFPDLGAGFRQLWRESWVPAPAMAVAVAALIGTGSGAFITHTVLSKSQLAAVAERSPGRDGGELAKVSGVAVNPAGGIDGASAAPASAPTLAPAVGAELASAAAESPTSPADRAAAMPAVQPEQTPREVPATGRVGSPAKRPQSSSPMTVASATPSRRPRNDRSLRAADRVEVAPWAANGGQPIEGPPSVSQVEYILNLVDVNQERVLQLPATAVVSGSTVTF
jgi:Putative zinc-finger